MFIESKQKYIIFFIPTEGDRKKISVLRSKMCKLCHTTQALSYPVHMSLTSGTVLQDISTFEKELQKLCKKEKAIPLTANAKTDIVIDRFWTGISINNSEKLLKFQQKIEFLKNTHAIKSNKMHFIPHITLAFPAKVDEIKPIINPVQKMMLNRISIFKKDKNGKYRVYKHISFGF